MAKVVVVPTKDIQTVVQLGMLFAADVPAMKNYNPRLALENVYATIDAGIGKLYGLIQDGEYVGFLFSMTFPDLFTGVLTSQEMAWYVKKEHRKYGLKLLRAFEEDCIKQGVGRIVMCQLVESMPEKIERLYTRLGYIKQDILYRKDL